MAFLVLKSDLSDITISTLACFLFFNFSITVNIQQYFVLISGV